MVDVLELIEQIHLNCSTAFTDDIIYNKFNDSIFILFDGTFIIIDYKTKSPIKYLEEYSKKVTDIQIAPTLNLLAISYEDYTIKIFDLNNYKLLSTYKNDSICYSMCFSDDSENLYFGDHLCYLKELSISNNTVKNKIKISLSGLQKIICGEAYLFTFAIDTCIYVIEKDSFTLKNTLQSSNDKIILDCSVNLSNSYLVVLHAYSFIEIWDLNSANLIHTTYLQREFCSKSITFLNDDLFVVFDGFDLCVISVKTFRSIFRWVCKQNETNLCYCSDKKLLLAGPFYFEDFISDNNGQQHQYDEISLSSVENNTSDSLQVFKFGF
eukprot:TRINITY_DN11596_c0_g1_i1.p1 TRINITY_DN11596_c0_g1~~TRINITY_DN11596_c0_g1_i1.p1  ORF type:complete len:324 (-),score=70.22 TRINITY_DN11596_c0_g1_i1:120-1091(-)